MATWAEFESATPELAAAGRSLIEKGGRGSALLATVRGDLAPRIHPVTVGFVDGHLYTFVLASAKRRDLEQDGRYALHSHHDPKAPDEFMVRGRGRAVAGPERAKAAEGWAFEVDDGYVLFELLVDSAVLGRRATADDWPPRYTTWVG
jgi:pyridoxamine 5'-phosphate oxidase-like protein